ncbi:MAG TPA: hypothetical protein VNO30_47100 [Kofleriaceae bacterium]|nr:hypothetical protein [Kofleriaceae bacterium]
MKRPPSDRRRLARAFGVQPKRRGLAVATTGVLAGIGALGGTIAFFPAALIAAGVGGLMLRERRRVALGLREVLAWGFPVEGYRAWLLASEPAFDIELRRDIAPEVLIDSVAAVDTAIAVHRIGDRAFRIVTPRVALPDRRPGRPAIHLGDRELLRRIYDALLAPLHADIGIVVLRMGDLSTLSKLLPAAAPEPEAPSGDVFREPAMAAPPALQALVQVGTTAPVVREARRLGERDERILHAVGASPAGVGTVLALTAAGTMAVVQFFPPAWWLGTTGGLVAGVLTALRTNRHNAATVANLLPPQRFPIEGYNDWLLAGRPVFDLELYAPVDRELLAAELRRIEAFSVEANHAVRWVEDIAWLSHTRVRVETRPTLIHPTRRIEPFYGGSHPLFKQMLREVLEPLDARVGIVAIRMGGNVDRRIN